jgi:hypothetical protein
MNAARRRVLIVLPSAMMVRNWLSTEIATLLGHDPALQVTIVTPDSKDKAAAEAAGLAWHPLLRPRGAALGTRLRFMLGYLLHLCLVNRFNTISNFRGARERLMQSLSLRRIAIREGLPASRWFGFPLPRSRAVFNALSRIYRGRWQRQAEVEILFSKLQPDLLVLGHVQTHFTIPYTLAAGTRGIPILGMIGSWDQPTTKGPFNPGISRFLVQGRGVAGELEQFHGVTTDQIETVGWVQMDIYRRGGMTAERGELLADFGLAAGARYALFGAYPERLGRHEPDLCAGLAERLEAQNCVLVIRCHPIDVRWRERFGGLHRPPHVIVLPPDLGDLQLLASQIRHAEMVLSSAGTILLDAAALDTPAIAVALEDENEPYFNRLARRYDMEHWAALVKTGGIGMARSTEGLFELIGATLRDRNHNAEGRARLVAAHLAPLDGAAAQRIASAIVAAAMANTQVRA